MSDNTNMRLLAINLLIAPFSVLLCNANGYVNLSEFDEPLDDRPEERSWADHEVDSGFIDDGQHVARDPNNPLSNETIVINMLHAPNFNYDRPSLPRQPEVAFRLVKSNLGPSDDVIEYEDATSKTVPPKEQKDRLQDDHRRHWLVANTKLRAAGTDDTETKERNAALKKKILQLIQQTIEDSNKNFGSTRPFIEQYGEKPPYKIGFLLRKIKKSRDVLNELFNVAVKHRENWKALEELKIFELILHTNVDITNLVRQLVELHIDNTKATRTNRVVVL